jgi:hypothetical protein
MMRLTREPEAPATTQRKPPGRVAGASRSRVRFREPEAPATTRRKRPGRVAGAFRSRVRFREPEGRLFCKDRSGEVVCLDLMAGEK